MTDGNTYAINKHLNEREDWDALQEVTAELEQAEARIEVLELAVRYESDLAQQALDAREELEAKLAKVATRLQHIAANKISDEVSVVEWDTHDTFSILDGCILSARTTLAELKGQDDD